MSVWKPLWSKAAAPHPQEFINLETNTFYCRELFFAIDASYIIDGLITVAMEINEIQKWQWWYTLYGMCKGGGRGLLQVEIHDPFGKYP